MGVGPVHALVVDIRYPTKDYLPYFLFARSRQPGTCESLLPSDSSFHIHPPPHNTPLFVPKECNKCQRNSLFLLAKCCTSQRPNHIYELHFYQYPNLTPSYRNITHSIFVPALWCMNIRRYQCQTQVRQECSSRNHLD